MDDDEYLDFVAATYVAEEGTGGGKLSVSTSYDGFAGRGEAYFDAGDLVTFANRLQQYPLDPDLHVVASSGLFVDADHVSFDVSPRGGRGQVIIRLRLAVPDWSAENLDTLHEVIVEFPTSYEYLGRFGRALEGIVGGRCNEARIHPDVLA